MRYAVMLSIVAAGCATTKGSTAPEKRKYVLEMREQALADLFAERPHLEEEIARAPGYATFSNIGTNIILVTTGGGFGVVRNNKTGDDTFMRMAELGVGLGLRFSDFRAVFVFHDQATLERFVSRGWEFGAEAEATARSGDQGGGLERAVTASPKMDIYQLTEAGVALSASISGTKFWKDKDLHDQ